MTTPLSDEQRRALDQQPDGIEVQDPQTQKVYFVSDVELHRRAMKALRRQEDHDAIQSGIEDMEAGRVMPYEQFSQQLRTHLKKKYNLPLADE